LHTRHFNLARAFKLALDERDRRRAALGTLTRHEARWVIDESWGDVAHPTEAPGRASARRRGALLVDPYVAVDLRLLQHDSLLPFDLYQRLNGMYVLYRHRDRPFDQLTRSRLMGNGINWLWVTDDDAPALGRYFEDHLTTIVRDRSIPSPVRARVMQAATYALASDLLNSPEEAIGRAVKLVEQLTRFAAVEARTLTDLLSLMESRQGLHVHSANTAIFALALTLGTGTEDPTIMAKAAIAGFLHDVGMTAVDEAVLLKPAPLDDAEREIVKTHPRIGAARLRRGKELPDDVCEALETHHERLDGSGYPDGLRAADISPLARIIAVAEVFDSLTSDQPWRKRFRPFDAAKLMLTEMPGLDEHYVRLQIAALRA
jgi:HD-GYP domain-containing protein (c-di-GMP phosphodiesterase class II)